MSSQGGSIYKAASAPPGERERLLSEALEKNELGAWEPGPGGMTPLMAACRADWPEGARRLARAGASLTETDDWGQSALTEAAAAGALGALKELLRLGAPVDELEVSKESDWRPRQSALEIAAERGDEDMCKTLVERGARAREALLGGVKAWRRDEIGADKALIMLRLGADPREADEYGLTALHMAADGGDAGVGLALELLAAGADPNARDQDGCSPLGVALRIPSAEASAGRMAMELLRAGADPGAREKGGASPQEGGGPFVSESGLAALRAWREGRELDQDAVGANPKESSGVKRL